MSPNMKGRIRKWREERTARAWVREEGLGMLTPKDARELDLESQAPDPLPCPHCGKPLGGSASTSRAGCSGSPTSRVADRVSSGLRPRRRPARLQRRRRSTAPGSDGQARESTTRMQDAAINDPTCAAFVESYAPGRGIGLFIHGVFCQVVLNKWRFSPDSTEG